MVKTRKNSKKQYYLLVLIAFIMFMSSCNFFDIEELPSGEIINTVYSPDRKHIINSYVVNGNATVDFSVRCEVVSVESNNKRNIYWEYHCDQANVKWIDNNTVEINGKTLNVITDSYDWRKN